MTEVKYLLLQKDKLNDIINKQENELKESKKELEKIENKLIKICNHKWIENDYYGPYDKISKTCSICNLTNY